MQLVRVRSLVAAVLALGLLASVAPAGAMTCAGPQLLAAEPAVAPGTTVLVSGRGFATCPGSGDQEPATDVEFSVRVNDAEKAIGTIDVGSDFDFVLDVHIPPSLGTGEGAIIARWDGRPGGPAEAIVPITVAGSPGDAGDRPYFEVDARESSSPDWLWLGPALLLGLTIGLVLATLRRRQTA